MTCYAIVLIGATKVLAFWAFYAAVSWTAEGQDLTVTVHVGPFRSEAVCAEARAKFPAWPTMACAETREVPRD